MRAQLPVHERHPAEQPHELIHTCSALSSVAADGAYALDLQRGHVCVGACREPASRHPADCRWHGSCHSMLWMELILADDGIENLTYDTMHMLASTRSWSRSLRVVGHLAVKICATSIA